jgi:hypothetical protein
MERRALVANEFIEALDSISDDHDRLKRVLLEFQLSAQLDDAVMSQRRGLGFE